MIMNLKYRVNSCLWYQINKLSHPCYHYLISCYPRGFVVNKNILSRFILSRLSFVKWDSFDPKEIKNYPLGIKIIKRK